MERTNAAIFVWFWSRSDPTVPADVAAGGSTVTTDNWVCPLSQGIISILLRVFQGEPSAAFPSTTCDIADMFVAHNIIINLSLCNLPASWVLNK
jgi:hypothetical protein